MKGIILLAGLCFTLNLANAHDFQYIYAGQTITYTVLDAEAKNICNV